MTIDERLEALTQSVELMASMQKDQWNQTRAAFAETAQLINQLARVVETHEQRLDKIEHRQ